MIPIVACRVVRGGVATGADAPDRLVGDDAALGVGRVHAVERRGDLVHDAGLGLLVVVLLERLADADDRAHAVAEHGPALAVHVVVGLVEELAALRVPDDHVLHVQAGEHRGADLAGERALVLPVAVLRAELDREAVGLGQGLEGAQVCERRAHDDVAVLVVGGLEAVGELLDDLDRDQVVVVHLPVGRDDRAAGHGFGSRRAARPGRSPCSRNSSDASAARAEVPDGVGEAEGAAARRRCRRRRRR